jgi:hypothetical protein
MLTFWSDADPDLFRDVVHDSLAGLEPKAKVRRVLYEDGVALFPETDEVIVAMGTGPVATLQQAGQIAKNKSITSLRETTVAYKVSPAAGEALPSPPSFGHWMFSFSPNSVFVEADKRSLIAWDARLAHRFYTTRSLEPPLGLYGWVNVEDDAEYWGFDAVIQYVEMKYEELGRPVSVALDLETMGLVPWYEDKEIVTVQLSVEPEYSDVAYMLDPLWKEQPAKLYRLLTQLRWIMTSPKVALIGANLKFDILWTWVAMSCLWRGGSRRTSWTKDGWRWSRRNHS